MIHNAINEVLIARFQLNGFLRFVLMMLLEVFSVFSPDTGALVGGLTCVPVTPGQHFSILSKVELPD